jgi:hypothetical protein
MEIVGEVQHDLLAFVRACNQGGYTPTGREVMAWQENPKPMEGIYRHEDVVDSSAITRAALAHVSLNPFSGFQSAIGDAFAPWAAKIHVGTLAGSIQTAALFKNALKRRVTVREPETTIAHLVRLGWLSVEGGDDRLRLTSLGSALLRDADRDTDAQGGSDVLVLGAEDPVAYPDFIGRISDLGPALIIDPYLKVAAIQHLLQHTQVNRLLVRSDARREITSISVMLSVAQNLDRVVEFRSSSALHDRWIIPDSGGAFLLGASISGVGNRATTVLCPMPGPVQDVMRGLCEQWWNEGEAEAESPSAGAPDGA